MEQEVIGNSAGFSARATSAVLVADSDARSLFFLDMILQRLGHPVCTASNGEKALEKAYFAAPSLIISELNLRGMNGLELMRRLRQERRISTVPFIMMASEHTPELKERCCTAGAADFLEKPVQADELYRAICPIIEPTSRRAHIRIQASPPVAVNDRLLDCAEGERATSLSVNGMQIRALRTYSVNSLLLIQLTLHGRDITAEARVVYCRPSNDDRSGMSSIGLQFLNISPQGGEIIREFINNEVTYGIAPGLA